MDRSSATGGRRRLPNTHYAEDQAFDQIAKEVSVVYNHFIIKKKHSRIY